MTKQCGVPSCRDAAVGSCRWKMRKRAVDVDGNVSHVPNGEVCGLHRCLRHINRGAGGEALCLWHKDVAARDALAQTARLVAT